MSSPPRRVSVAEPAAETVRLSGVGFGYADSPEVLAKNQLWLSRFHDRMEAYTSAYCYQNFIDPSQRDYLHAYYGENLPRLQAVKRKYDPGDLFRYPQSIPV